MLKEVKEFDWNTLARAALIASGTEGEAIPAYMKVIDGLRLEAREYMAPGITDYEKGERLLAFLHERILFTYDELQTRLDVLLDTSRFNCASSAVLYLIMARDLGLDSGGVATDDHVFCFVRTGEKGSIDVETTTPYGFEPGQKKAFQDSFGNITGYSYVPPGNYSMRTVISDRQVLGIILQNRMSLLEKKSDYAGAASLGVDRYTLIRSESAAAVMRGEFINYAALLNRKGKYEEGLAFIDRARKVWGDNDDYREIIEVLVHNVLTVLTEEGRFPEGEMVLKSRFSAGDIDEKVKNTLDEMITLRRLNDYVRSAEPAEALEEVLFLYEAERINRENYSKYSVFLYGRMAEEKGKEKNWIEGLRILERGIEQLGKDPQLLKAKRVFQSNVAVDAHNDAAELLEKERFDEALARLEEALEIVPGNSTLLKDIGIIKEMSKRK